MNDWTKVLGALGVGIPEPLLPSAGLDHGAWAVVACDQYSSEREYWERVEEKYRRQAFHIEFDFSRMLFGR
jgi:hypothetical protein